MATVITYEVKLGEMFGGAGAAIFRPYDRNRMPVSTARLTHDELLADTAEASLRRLVSQNWKNDTDESGQGE